MVKKMWTVYKAGYKAWLQLEKSLSNHSVDAYLNDLDKLIAFLEVQGLPLGPEKVDHKVLLSFIEWLHGLGMTERTQARILSGLRSFYMYCSIEEITMANPTALLEMPRLRKKLPAVLNYAEIELIFQQIDLSTPAGIRNRAILETMYSCGLRVSEATDMRLTGYYPDVEYVRIRGKGDKERLIPIGSSAIKYIEMYLKHVRSQVSIAKGHDDFVFLNHRGKKLSRVTIFTTIKELASKAGIQKNVSPHTFRHSFATHLVEGGADLRAVQEMLGHESITTTEIYTHLDQRFLRETLEKYHPGFMG